jgi:hypothetical protein
MIRKSRGLLIMTLAAANLLANYQMAKDSSLKKEGARNKEQARLATGRKQGTRFRIRVQKKLGVNLIMSPAEVFLSITCCVALLYGLFFSLQFFRTMK